MRATTAYFVGAGTVIAAIVVGLGGGLLIAEIVSPKSPRQEMTRLEHRMLSQPIQAKAGPSEPVPAVPAQPQPQTEAANTARAATPPAETAAATPPLAPAARPETSPSQPVVQKQTAAAPEDALARAKNSDIKRAAAEKRKAERRERWVERRQQPRRQDQELLEVEEKVREVTGPRPVLAADPVRAETPRIRLFDLD
jgi:hypothetical protein